MGAPEPMLPESNALPILLWLCVVLVVVALSVIHAVRRQRAAWVVGMVLVPPVAIAGYWAVELLRPASGRDEVHAIE